MEPTLAHNLAALVDKITYCFRLPGLERLLSFKIPGTLRRSLLNG